MTIHLKDIILFSTKSLSRKKEQIYAASRRGYALLVQGCPSEITTMRTRGDPADVDRYIDNAVFFVDGQPDERWINCYRTDGDTYDMAVCPCLYPSIVCRAVDGDGPHNETTSRQTTEVMASLKLKMGINNYAILNALRKRDEMMATVQQGQEGVAAADHDDAEQVAHGEQEVELQPPPPAAQMQKVDCTPSRSTGFPQAYEEYDVLYGDDQQQGGQRRPQGRPMGKADKVPIWKGASVERWQEFTVSLQAWHLANWEFMTAAQAVHKVYEMFRAAAADSLSSYMLAGSTIPPFSDILYDIDCLFKVNRIANALDIVNELNFKSSTATDTVAKIEKLLKLVTGGNVSIRDIFMAQSSQSSKPLLGNLLSPPLPWTQCQLAIASLTNEVSLDILRRLLIIRGDYVDTLPFCPEFPPVPEMLLKIKSNPSPLGLRVFQKWFGGFVENNRRFLRVPFLQRKHIRLNIGPAPFC